MTVIQSVDEIIQVKVKVIVRLEENASAVLVILSDVPTHGIRCGVYPEKFCTYIDVICERRIGIWVVIIEGVKVENFRHSAQYVLSKGLIEWKRPQTSQHNWRTCKESSGNRGARVGVDRCGKSTGQEDETDSKEHGGEQKNLAQVEVGEGTPMSGILNDDGNGIWAVNRDSLLAGENKVPTR